jgi:asparagine synthase (glutamine-hydrolysing)
MTYIYGQISKFNSFDENALSILKNDLSRYPTDGFVPFSSDGIQGGQFYQRLHKAPHPIEQPVQHNATGIIIFANARLDYKADLLKRLNKGQNELRLCSETQLILEAYLKWGESCVDYLEGDFSFIVLNPARPYIWGACDPIGFRPLFFSALKDTFCFSSHTRGLSQIPAVNNSPDEGFFQNRFMQLDTFPILRTPFAGVKRIPVGHTVKIEGESIIHNKYFHWQIIPTKEKKSNPDYANELSHLIKEAVATRLYTDYPVGGHLSGGLDSTAVLSLADQLLNKQGSGHKLITTSSVHVINSKKPAKDERPWVNTFKKYFPETEVNPLTYSGEPELRPEDAEFLATIRFKKYPTVFTVEMLDNHLIEKGCRTCLTGWRGDHFISYRGYAAYSELLKRGRLIHFIQAINTNSRFRNRKVWSFLRSFALSNQPKRDFNPREFYGATFINQDWINASADRFEPNPQHRSGFGLSDMNWDFIKLLPEYVGATQYYEDLSFGDKAMCLRLNPLSDPRIINFALKLPAAEFVKDGMDRSIMRRAMKGWVPDELRLRKSKGSFMGDDEVELNALTHQLWLERDGIKDLIDNSPMAPFINQSKMKNQVNIQLERINKGNYQFHPESRAFLNILGFLFYFDINR